MTEDRRTKDRRRETRRAPPAPLTETAPGRALVPAAVSSEPPRAEPSPEPSQAKPRRAGFTTFAAQVLGQGGQKRGLRGGPETLDRARATYLETEWSGAADRRPTPGRITKTEI